MVWYCIVLPLSSNGIHMDTYNFLTLSTEIFLLKRIYFLSVCPEETVLINFCSHVISDSAYCPQPPAKGTQKRRAAPRKGQGAYLQLNIIDNY